MVKWENQGEQKGQKLIEVVGKSVNFGGKDGREMVSG